MSPDRPLDDESDQANPDKSAEPAETGGTDETVDPNTTDSSERSTEYEESNTPTGSEETDPKSISNIQRVVIDPEELIRALAYNGQEDIGRKGKTVFSLTPPFGECVEPSLRHLEDDSTESKADDEIHLRPFRFVVDGRQAIEERPTRRLAAAELEAEDPDDATIEARVDETMAAWKARVRDNLAESVDIFSPHGMAIVSVEYRSKSDSEE